jgi:hypothetical protein
VSPGLLFHVLSSPCRIKGSEWRCLANVLIGDLQRLIGSGMECKSAITGIAGEQ